MRFGGRCDVAAGVRWNVGTNVTLVVLVFLGIASYCQAYFSGGISNIRPVSITKFPECKTPGNAAKPWGQLYRCAHASMPSSLASSPQLVELRMDVISGVEAGQFDEAIEALERQSTGADMKYCYSAILQTLVEQQEQKVGRPFEEKDNIISKPKSDKDTARYNQACKVLDRLIELGELDSELLPTAEDFNYVIKMWGSSTFVDGASVKCQSYLNTLWSLYNKHQDPKFVPLKESYSYAIHACSERDRSLDAATRAESLMKEMESLSQKHPHLIPDRSIANEVMNAWSKSGHKFKQGKKCEKVLEQMLENANMTPDTKSFNIVLNALAQGKEKNSEVRAEELLQRMEVLSSSGEGDAGPIDCQPDETSFNTVLNGWASSRQWGAADRAITILEHMKKRYEAGLTKVHPDLSTYNTVLKALAKWRDPTAIDRAEAVFQEYLEGCGSGKVNLSHNAFTYNSMINCYAKSKHPEAGKRSLELFETMKENSGKPGWELCFVDIFTYTSLIDAISKEQSLEGSEKAISLLEEVEKAFADTGDIRFQPNIRLYTSVVNAIGRSHKEPSRAQDVVNRIESSYLQGLTQLDGKPDVVFYNALINAYGWSDMKGRSRKGFEILKHMISLYESGELDDAKPDTVSFNSVLNACAHERTKDRDDVMKIVVETFELLNNSPEYGQPDQNTYVQILISIASHMGKNDPKRGSLAEATFLQCAANGLVSPFVISKLHCAIPNELFQSLMGAASTGGKQLRYDISKLPPEWTENSMTPGSRTRRSSSRRRGRNFQVTKNLISHSMQKATIEKG